MPDEQAQEPILEIGAMEKGGGAASAFFVLTFVITLLFVGFLIVWHYHLSSVANNKKAAFSALQEQLNDKSNKQIKDRANSATMAIQILSNASKSRYLFRAFIDQLDSKITNDTKLNSLSIDSAGKVSLDGESASYRSVADLAVALSTSDKLTDVVVSNLSQSSGLSTTTSGNSQTASPVTFSISAKIKDWKVSAEENQAIGTLPSTSDVVPAVGGL